VNAVILSVMLVGLAGGQVPLPAAPDLPIPPDLTQMPTPVNGAPIPPPTTQEVAAPPSRSENTKPPPFHLIDPNRAPESISLKPAPTDPPEPMLTGAGAAPHLVVTRNGPANVRAGEPFSYEILVKNDGTMPTTQLRLEEHLPPGTKLLKAQPMAVSQDARLVWTMDSLAPDEQQSFKVEVEASRDGEWSATGTLLTVSVSSTMKTNVGSIAQRPLTMTGPGSLPVGHPVELQMRVANSTATPMTDLLVRVQMAPGLQHMHGDAIEANIGDLAPGQSKDLTLEAITAQTGRLTAEATLLSGKKALANAQAVIVATDQPTLVLRQTGPLAPPVGGEHEFKLEITNRSAGEVREVEVSDALPEGLQFTAADSRAQFDAASRTLRWKMGTLAPGQSRQMVFRAQVRGAGPQVNRISARAAGVAEAQLQTVLRLGGGH
jgi:uncharacterized repeat protein (TIGR01451 family)